MSTAEELQKWVKTLTPAEKRFITLIGKARAGAGSQLLDFFEWLNHAKEGEAIPTDASFYTNVPTLAVRLRELILDSLRLLGKATSTESILRSSMLDIDLLLNKKLDQPAARLIRKTKKMALDNCRYLYALQCLEAEFRLLYVLPPNEVEQQLIELREEEILLQKQQTIQQELLYRHRLLLSLAKQFPFSRDETIIARIHQIADVAVVNEALASSAYLEQALAVNSLGIKDLYNRQPIPAVKRYQQMLKIWKQHPEWQADQSELLLTICKYYQNACFYSPIDPEIVQEDLLSLDGFNGLSEGALRTFREMLFHNKFIRALNTANLQTLKPLIQEIDLWLEKEKTHLNETQLLPFLCNFSVAQFLSEDFSTASATLRRMQELPNKKTRADIRQFSILLQAVVFYELNDEAQTEASLRSGKRFFSKTATSADFEITVFRCLDDLRNMASEKEKRQRITALLAQLNELASERHNALPVLGLNEIRIWANARSAGKALDEVFASEVTKAWQKASIQTDDNH